MLRHTFASHLVMPLKAVQELLGHATMDMTLRYAPDVRRDAVKLLNGPAQHGRNMKPSAHPNARSQRGKTGELGFENGNKSKKSK